MSDDRYTDTSYGSDKDGGYDFTPTPEEKPGLLSAAFNLAKSLGDKAMAAYDKNPDSFLNNFLKLGATGLAAAYGSKAASELADKNNAAKAAESQKEMDFRSAEAQKTRDEADRVLKEKIARNNASVVPYGRAASGIIQSALKRTDGTDVYNSNGNIQFLGNGGYRG